jgi:hypothetical protein
VNSFIGRTRLQRVIRLYEHWSNGRACFGSSPDHHGPESTEADETRRGKKQRPQKSRHGYLRSETKGSGPVAGRPRNNWQRGDEIASPKKQVAPRPILTEGIENERGPGDCGCKGGGGGGSGDMIIDSIELNALARCVRTLSVAL